MKQLCIVPMLSMLFFGLVMASAPNLANYQGRLTDGSGNPVANSTYSVTFAIYSVPSGGVALWSETQSVTTSSGLFAVLLGSTTPLGPTIFADSTRYLGTKVGADAEMTPRTRIASVPYALTSASSGGWQDDGALVRLQDVNDNVGIGTSTPTNRLHIVDSTGGIFPLRVEGTHTLATITEMHNTSSNTTWEHGVAGSDGYFFGSIAPGSSFLHMQGAAFPSVVLTPDRRVGLGTGSPKAQLDVQNPFDTLVGYFRSDASSHSATAIYGHYNGSGQWDATGVRGLSVSSPGYGYGGQFTGGYMGALGFANTSGSRDGYGLRGQVFGDGIGTKYGVSALSVGTGKNYGVFATGGAGTDTSFGVFAEAYGNNSRAVEGHAFSGTDQRGVVGTADGTGSVGGYFESNNKGVQAFVDGSGSGNSTIYCGIFQGTHVGNTVYGLYSHASGSGTNVALRAIANLGSSNTAGEFVGNVSIVGTLSKSAGSFTIDHPLDPENKYLQHSFVESPDMKNIYDGIVTLDANGQATITLPEWFGALNRDFRYQLTCVGGYAPVYISSKVANNQFSIAGGTPGLEVSWLLTGIRKDAYAEAHRIQVEVDKKPEERGKYQFPELFGKSEEFGIGFESNKMVREHSVQAASPAKRTPESLLIR